MMSSYVTEFESQTSNFFCLFHSWPLTKYSFTRFFGLRLRALIVLNREKKRRNAGKRNNYTQGPESK